MKISVYIITNIWISLSCEILHLTKKYSGRETWDLKFYYVISIPLNPAVMYPDTYQTKKAE